MDPNDTCEIPTWSDEICNSGTCISFSVIFASIAIANLGQLIFEAALLYTSSITFKPTTIEKRLSSTKSENSFNSEDEPSCEKVLKKCTGEMIVAATFLISILVLVISLIGVYNYGRPGTV